MAIVVPAHNEEQLLGRCLGSIVAATRELQVDRPSVQVRTVVVLDRCVDRTAMVASRFPVDCVEVDVGSVGVARSRGVNRAKQTWELMPAQNIWIASTDADSVVQTSWLSQQVQAAEGGARLVLGRVVPDPADLDEVVHAAWHHRHPLGGRIEHVHGANLGIRLDLYLTSATI